LLMLNWKGEDVPAVGVIGERVVACSLYSFGLQ